MRLRRMPSLNQLPHKSICMIDIRLKNSNYLVDHKLKIERARVYLA